MIMSPVSEFNLKIAPAFYIIQVDLTGAFKAYQKAMEEQHSRSGW